MTPQGMPIKASSFNDTVAASAWGFESMEIWEGREGCYRGKSNGIWAGHLERIFSSTPCSLMPLHTSHTRSPWVGTAELGVWSSMSQAQALKHVRASSAHQILEDTPPEQSLCKPDKLGGCFLLAAWWKAAYSVSHSCSPKGKRLAHTEKMKLRQS